VTDETTTAEKNFTILIPMSLLGASYSCARGSDFRIPDGFHHADVSAVVLRCSSNAANCAMVLFSSSTDLRTLCGA